MKKQWYLEIPLLAVLCFLPHNAHADLSSVLQTVCTNVDCLNNFTAKTGWSFAKKTEYSGGFTDLEQTWYVSPGPGFDVPMNGGSALFDVNIIFKLGKLASDKIPAIHTLVNSDPFASGLLGALTIGETGVYDASTVSGAKYFDITWLGATVKFGGSPAPSPAPAPPAAP